MNTGNWRNNGTCIEGFSIICKLIQLTGTDATYTIKTLVSGYCSALMRDRKQEE